MVKSVLLSLEVAGAATVLVVVVGTWLGYFLARSRWWGRWIIHLLALLPLVFPPTLTGYFLILFFGRNGILGRPLFILTGFQLTFHPLGAIVAASAVSFPIMVVAARAAIEGVDRELEGVGYLLGPSASSVFVRVTLPLAWRGLAAGAMLVFARALGEFGATLMMAGNLETMPIAIYTEWMSGGIPAAAPFVLAHGAMAIGIMSVALVLGRRYASAGS